MRGQENSIKHDRLLLWAGENHDKTFGFNAKCDRNLLWVREIMRGLQDSLQHMTRPLNEEENHERPSTKHDRNLLWAEKNVKRPF